MIIKNMLLQDLLNYLLKRGFAEFNISFSKRPTNQNTYLISISASPDFILCCNRKPVLCIEADQKIQAKKILIITDVFWKFEDAFISRDEHLDFLTRDWEEFCEKCKKIKYELMGEKDEN